MPGPSLGATMAFPLQVVHPFQAVLGSLCDSVVIAVEGDKDLNVGGQKRSQLMVELVFVIIREAKAYQKSIRQMLNETVFNILMGR